MKSGSCLRRFSLPSLFALLCLWMMFGALSFAQTQDIPPPKNPDTGPQINTDVGASPNLNPAPKPEDTPAATLKVNVDVVNLLFNTKDKGGKLVPDLKKEDFLVTEDGKPQTIKFFQADSNLPLTLGILLDTSYSQERVLPTEKEVGAEFLQQILRKQDEAFLISFDVNVDLLQDYTNSGRDIRAGMDAAKINGGGVVGGIPGVGEGPVPISHPKGTLLYDAVYLAAHDKLRSEVGRKALILLTDGEDVGSQLKLQDALEAAQKSDTIIYVLLISDRGFLSSGSGEGLMRKLADSTGGRVIDVGSNQEKLKKAFDQISEELRSQYSIGYTPTNDKHDGSFRHVEIKSKEGYKIQARKGYYAASGS
ncbi:MAG TPA: VWA domain-containing protein [Terriglobales bacterium]|nr:VWA domain-containing protein [Terriglobales bacterium]